MATIILKPAVVTTLQPDVAKFLMRAGAVGLVGAVATAALDEFEARGRAFGWWPKIKLAWFPVGDFAASKVPLISPTAWTFTDFLAADYSQEAGYVVRGENTSKVIATGFIPAVHGLSSKNLTLVYASTMDVLTENANVFGRIMGTATGDGQSLYVSNLEGQFGVGGGLNHCFGLAGTVAAATYDAQVQRSFVNGSFQMEKPSATIPLNDEILLYKTMRGDGFNYTGGSFGGLLLGESFTKPEAFDLGAAVTVLMTHLRTVYQLPALGVVSDSIGAGTGTGGGQATLGWAARLARALGFRLRNNSQGSSELTLNNNAGTISAINRIAPLLNLPTGVDAMVLGTNDMGNSGDVNGDDQLVQRYLFSLDDVANRYTRAGKLPIFGTAPFRSDVAQHSLVKQAKYAKQVADTALKYGLPFADLLHAFLDTANPAAYFPDGLHPNNEGHALIAEHLLYAWRGQLVRKPLIDFGPIAAGATSVLDVDVLTARPNMIVHLTRPALLEDGLIATACVSSEGKVTVSLTNVSGVAINPASVRYIVCVSTGL